MKNYTDLELRMAEANGMTVEQMLGSEKPKQTTAERISDLEDLVTILAEVALGGVEV